MTRNLLEQLDKKVFLSTKAFLNAIFLVIAFLPLISITAVAADSTTDKQAAGEACKLPDSIKNLPPLSSENPVEIKVGVFLINISGLKQQDEKFQADAAIHYSWNDPRLAARVDGKSFGECGLQIEDIWNPTIGVINIIGNPSYWFKTLSIDDNGNVRYSARVQAPLFSKFDLEEFPFDTQLLKIEFTSFAYDTNQVVIKQDLESTGKLEGIRVAGWNLVKNFSDDNIKPVRTLGKRERSRLNHIIVIERRSAYYIWNYAIPLCLIVLMASSVFWIDPEAFGPQIGISTASVFTLVAFLLGLRQGLPQVAYLTRMDEMVLGATIVVFISFAEVVYVSRLVHKDKAALARRIDWHARWIFVAVFGILLFANLIEPNI